MADANSRVRGFLEHILPRLRVVSGPDSHGEYVAWCPFHPDGQGEGPHRPNLHVSVRGFMCFACGEKGGLQKLARKLGIEGPEERHEPDVTYDYRDETGSLLFQVVRKPGKRFPQRRPDGEGGWIWDLEAVQRVLYQLPELLAQPEARVFLVEGEKDAESLAGLGLVATTNPGGAGKWRPEYTETLRGRDVVILPDNDAPGMKHAAAVDKALRGVANSVKVLELPGLGPKGDVTDWLAAGHSVEELRQLADATDEWTPATSGLSVASSKDGASAGGRPQATRLVDLALAHGIHLFHDERRRAYVRVACPERLRIMAVESQEFELLLRGVAWQEMRMSPSREVLSTAQAILAAKGAFEGDMHRLEVRTAWHEGAIWLDLDGSRAVRVEPGKWTLVEQPPILFRSFPHHKALPVPIPGGNLSDVLEFVNLRDDGLRLLFLCYLAAAMVPDIPVAALIVHGVQGSAKTTLLKVAKDLLDPGVPAVRRSVGGPAEFALAAFHTRVLYFDNLTRIRDWLSDSLCSAVTGDGWSKRTLYTDEDSTVFEYKRVVGLAGINMVAERPDLLDRSLIVDLPPVAPDERKEERAFWETYGRVRPRILGGLLDVLAEAMCIAPGLNFHALPRMADFARWAAAAAEALGQKAEGFLEAYGGNVRRQNEAAVEVSPVAQAVLSFMERRDEWEGTATELLESLSAEADDLKIDVRAPPWPKAANWLPRRLREVEANLLSMGMRVEQQGRSASKRGLRLTKVSRDAVIAVTAVRETSDTDEKAVRSDGSEDDAVAGGVITSAQGMAFRAPGDASDVSDGIPRPQQAQPVASSFPWCEAYWERVAIMAEEGELPEEEAPWKAGELVLAEFGGLANGPML